MGKCKSGDDCIFQGEAAFRRAGGAQVFVLVEDRLAIALSNMDLIFGLLIDPVEVSHLEHLIKQGAL